MDVWRLDRGELDNMIVLPRNVVVTNREAAEIQYQDHHKSWHPPLRSTRATVTTVGNVKTWQCFTRSGLL